ncbi:hypothetical protein [Chromobacterium sp. ASV23]|uniref:hypothetical protein n=1 Tax=Chromobacterium sp. ASV23 TaxID=2795110 RepID=UPI0018ED9017|nr:hypothetical protein [Chromobacterium sp. ASV23]
MDAIGQLTFMDLFHIFFGSALAIGAIVAFIAQRRVRQMRNERARVEACKQAGESKTADLEEGVVSAADAARFMRTLTALSTALHEVNPAVARYRTSSPEAHHKKSLRAGHSRHAAPRDEHGGLAAS